MPGDYQVKGYERKITPIERLFTRSPYSIVTMVARIKGGVSESMLRGAVSKARRRRPHLRVRIVEDKDGDSWFTSDGAADVPVEVVPRESDDHWIRVAQDASQLPFDFDARPAVRLILVRSPFASELIILCHYILCDGLSLAYLARDLMHHLGDPDREVEVLPDPVPMQRDTIPEDVSLNAVVRFLITRMNRKWERERIVFDQQDYRDLNEAYWMHYSHRMLCAELSEAQTLGLVLQCGNEPS